MASYTELLDQLLHEKRGQLRRYNFVDQNLMGQDLEVHVMPKDHLKYIKTGTLEIKEGIVTSVNKLKTNNPQDAHYCITLKNSHGTTWSIDAHRFKIFVKSVPQTTKTITEPIKCAYEGPIPYNCKVCHPQIKAL